MNQWDEEWDISGLYSKYASLVHGRCLKILWSEDEAWDATQEIFMKLMQSIDKIKKTDSLYYWLQRTTTNHCISILRKKRGVAFDEAYHVRGDNESNPEREMWIKDLTEKIFKPWNKATQEIVIYTYIDGYTQAEISQMMGIGESTIRKYLTKFRRKTQEWKSKKETP